MKLNMDMLNFKPKLKEDLITYSRKEKNGFYTIRFNSPLMGNEIVLNNTFINIMNAFNGKNSIQDIICSFMSMYKDAVEDTLSKDICEVLKFLTNIQGITWLGTNPFISSFEKDINEYYKIKLANYTDIDTIMNFINTSQTDFNKANYISYVNPFEGKKIMCKNNILVNLTIGQNFIVEKNGQVVGNFSFQFSSSKINCMQYFVFNKEISDISKCINYAISIIQKNKFSKAKCFRTYLLNQTDFLLKDKLKETGFTKTMLLKNELGSGIDVQELNYYV